MKEDKISVKMRYSTLNLVSWFSCGDVLPENIIFDSVVSIFKNANSVSGPEQRRLQKEVL